MGKKRGHQQPTTNQQPIIVAKAEHQYIPFPGLDSSECDLSAIPVWQGNRGSNGSPNVSIDSAIDSVSSQYSSTPEPMPMTVRFSHQKYYQQPAQQFYNDTFGSLPYQQKLTIQSILKQLDQKTSISKADQDLLINYMARAGFILTTAAAPSLYEQPVIRLKPVIADEEYYAEPGLPLYVEPIRQGAALNESSDEFFYDLADPHADEELFGFRDSLDIDLDRDDYPDVTYDIASDPTKKAEFDGTHVKRNPLFTSDGQELYALATDRSGDPLYGPVGNPQNGEEYYAIATDRSKEPLYQLGKDEQGDDELENEYALATNRSQEGGIYGVGPQPSDIAENPYEMYDTIPAHNKQKRAPEPAPRHMMPPQVPVRRSLLKHTTDSSTDAPFSSLIAVDDTLSKVQQDLIGSILNLIKETPVEDDKQQVIATNISLDTSFVTRKSNVIRRNLHIILPTAILVGGTAGFLAYWFNKVSSSPEVPGGPENEALTMCQNASNAAFNLGLRLVNGLFSVTSAQANALCSSIEVSESENCLSFLTQNCTQLFSGEASSVDEADKEYFGFFEAVSTATHAVTATASTVANTIATAASHATTGAMTSASTTLTEALTTSTTSSSTGSTFFTTLAPLTDAITTVTTSAGDLATTATTFVTDTLATASTTATDVLTTAASTASTLASTTSTMATEALTTLATTASATASTVTSTLSSTTSSLTSTASTVASTLASTTSTVASTIASTASTTASTIASTTSTVASTIASTTSSIWSTVTSTTSTLFQGSSSLLTSTTTTIRCGRNC